MNVTRIIINNILGLASLDIEPGRITEITGANGSGKTSILEAVKSALGGGHDASLLRNGAEKGEVVLVLDEGIEVRRTVTADKSTTTVKHPEFGKISKPAEYLKNLTDALSVNPIKFLTAEPKERVNALLAAIPMKVTPEQIGFVPADVVQLTSINFNDHAMVVLELLRKAVYDTRTGVNRSLKDKEATARQLSETFTEAPPEGDWKSQLAAVNTELESIQDETKTLLRKAKAVMESSVAAADGACNSATEEAERLYVDEFKYIKNREEIAYHNAIAARDEKIQSAREARDGAANIAREVESQIHKELETEYRPKEAALKEKIGHISAMIEQEARAQETRKLADQMKSEAQKLSEDSDALTEALDKLESLKSSLLSSLPISGLEVRDGEITVNDVPWNRLNEAARVGIAIEIAKLRAGKLGLIAVDGLENLDDSNYLAFKTAALQSGVQFVVSRVSNEPLSVATSVA